MYTLLSTVLVLSQCFLLSACTQTGNGPAATGASNLNISQKLAKAFFEDLANSQYDEATRHLADDFEYFTNDPVSETKVFSSKEDFKNGARETFKVFKTPIQTLGRIEKYPWFMYILGFSHEGDQYQRFCNLKMMAEKINEMRCYIGTEEYTDIMGKRYPMENRNLALAANRKNINDYNKHDFSNCKPDAKINYFKFYPTYSKNIYASDEDQCAGMVNYFKEADPSSLKLRTWHNPPWQASELTFASRYTRINRIGVRRTHERDVLEIHNFIPLEAFLFREYMVNLGVNGPLAPVFPPFVKTAFSEWIARQQNEPLLRYRADGSIEGGVVQSFSWSKDNTELSLKLDTFKRFSDGTYLEADDIKNSWERSSKFSQEKLNPLIIKFLNRIKGFQDTGSLSGVEISDVSSLTIKFDSPFNEATKYLTSVAFAPYKRLGERDLGTGPYTVWEGREQTDKLVLWPNRFYPINLTSLTFVNIQSEDKDLKKLDLQMKLNTQSSDVRSGCQGVLDNWDCKIIKAEHGYSHFPDPANNEPFIVELSYDVSKIHPSGKLWESDPFSFKTLFVWENFTLDKVTQDMVSFKNQQNLDVF